MPFVKKLVMQGFKSFARRTEIPFENAMNVIVGPNGSGKSNITDALCFVLGRLSIKSIRAAKAANLLFSGNKIYKASQEASVELVFDNTDRAFAMDAQEITIKRIVRRNGLSIYKINGETKTRQELLELMAQAGIDPNGFNIVLQGEIASLIKLTPEERRKIIEEVAGISIYETRKQKSIKELEKTEEQLKEVSAVLKERNSYLKNLDRERQEAMFYQKLEETIKKCKATLLDKKVKQKNRELAELELVIENQTKEIQKIKAKINEKNALIQENQEKINEVNKKIQSSTSNEQESLHRELSDLRADVAGLEVRKENFETRLNQGREEITEIKSKIKQSEESISNIKTTSPKIKEQQSKQKELQEKLDVLEKKRRQFYILKSDLLTEKNRKLEKERYLIESRKELEMIQKSISTLSDEIKHAHSLEKASSLKQETREHIENARLNILELDEKEIEIERENAILEQESKREERLKQDIVKLDICPLCKSQVTKEHVKEVIDEADKKITSADERQKKNIEHKHEIKLKTAELKENLSKLESKLNEIEIDILKLRAADEKKEQIKKLMQSQTETLENLKNYDSKIKQLEEEFERIKNIESEYDEARLNLQEISFVDVDVDTEMQIKQRDINRLTVDIKSITRDTEEAEQELKKISQILSEKYKLVEKKEKEEQELYERAEKFFNLRNEVQDKQKALETDVIGLQHESRNHEDKINGIKIQKAQINAQNDSIKTELNEISQGGKLELIQESEEKVREKLQNAEFKIARFSTVNLKALEVYEKIKEQVSQIEQKVQVIESEKIQVAKIIEEIDKKKKKSFMKTLDAVNEYFTRNFSQLSKKGEVFLELENKQNPFDAGLNILIKVARGKYFDITSLSGGEKTLVALSLIFAIQEYKPYCFYIFDEIDAALDKHNSELLAALIKKYMTTGQYIIITHNDALISEASTLYGVSMQENISKVISLKI